jgi:8-hydroxy-5-deazaflavin:NADPH oxidoreductase
MTAANETIAVLGGTGQLGRALARRLARSGRSVIVGSRSADLARAAAQELSTQARTPVKGDSNGAAARDASLVFMTVPFAAQSAILQEVSAFVQGKILVDTTVPLAPPKVTRAQLPAEGSAAVIAQRVLGSGVRVVSALHNIAAHKLATDSDVDCDTLVFGDDKAAREIVVQVLDSCGLRTLHGGALANSSAAEALTSVLIFLNKTYGISGAGIRITGTSG